MCIPNSAKECMRAPQAVIITNGFLTKDIAPHGYYQFPHIQYLWKHKWRPATFYLLVDDFGVKYVEKMRNVSLLAPDSNIQYQLTEPAASTAASRWNGITANITSHFPLQATWIAYTIITSTHCQVATRKNCKNGNNRTMVTKPNGKPTRTKKY